MSLETEKTKWFLGLNPFPKGYNLNTRDRHFVLHLVGDDVLKIVKRSEFDIMKF